MAGELGREEIAQVDRSGMLADVLAIPDHLRDALWRVDSAGIAPSCPVALARSQPWTSWSAIPIPMIIMPFSAAPGSRNAASVGPWKCGRGWLARATGTKPHARAAAGVPVV